MMPIDPVPDVRHLGLGICDPTWTLPIRVIHEYEWVVMVQGKAIFHLDEKEYPVVQGDALLIPPGVPHRAVVADPAGCRFYFVHFIPSIEPGMLTHPAFTERMVERKARLRKDLAEAPFFSLPQTRLREVPLLTHFPLNHQLDGTCTRFEHALEERNHYAVDSQIHIGLLVAHMLASASRVVMDEWGRAPLSEDGVMNRTLQDALEILHAGYGKPISIRELATRLGVSGQYLGRLFMRRLGCSPLQYVNRLRLDRAKALMRETRLPLQEVAWASGFENAFYFSRLFHKLEGESPSRYRERLAIRGN